MKRNPSEKFVKQHIGYLRSNAVRKEVRKSANSDDILTISDAAVVKKIYLQVKSSPDNIRLHNI